VKDLETPDTPDFADLALTHSSDAVLVLDTEGQIVWLNRGFARLYGYSFEESLGRRPLDFLAGADTSKQAMADIIACREHRRHGSVEVLLYRQNGQPVWIERSITPVFDAVGRNTHVISIDRDVTKRRQLEEKTRTVVENEGRRQNERKLLSQISEWLYSAKSLDELLMVVGKSMQTLLPEADGELYIYSTSRDTLDLMAHWGDSAPDPHIDAEECWSLRRGRAYSYGTRAIEFPCGHVTGVDCPYFCLPIIAHGETIGLLHLRFSAFELSVVPREHIEDFLGQRWELGLLCAEQVSLAVANVQLRQELQEQSMRDALTGLWNRRWFLEAAHRETRRAEQGGGGLSLISLDVDHFKKFNDQHGHDAGDLVLKEFGALMTEVFHDRFSPCRIGGEEFVVICPATPNDEAMALAEEFRQRIGDVEVQYGGKPLPRITASAGVSSYPEDGKQTLEMLKTADDALYLAKDRGRNTVVSASEARPAKPVRKGRKAAG